MIAQAFHKGFIATEGQKKLITDLLGEFNSGLKPKFYKEYAAFNYLDETYKNTLLFEEGIAIAEKGGDKNPLSPGVYALHVYNESNLELFDLHVTYLKKRMLVKGDECYWNYEKGVERFSITGPWVSCISQGIIASVFLRKYHVNNEAEYLEIAKGAIAYCLNRDNGLVTEMDDGFWIEEYPSGTGKGVLNGFIFFLIALGELASFGFFVKEFEEGIRTLMSELPSFHKGVYILYGKNIPDLGNSLYDNIHFHQLDALYKLTSVSGFYSLKEYWRNTSETEFL